MDFWHLSLVACYQIYDNAGAPSVAQNTPEGFLEEPWPPPCLQGFMGVGQERQTCGDAQAIPNGGNRWHNASYQGITENTTLMGTGRGAESGKRWDW